MTIVVTGASGHIGNNLVRALLSHGEHVRALVHHDSKALEGLDVETVHGDVLDTETLENAFEGADVVFHTAAYITVASTSSPRLETVNVRGPKNVCEAAHRCGVRRLVHFSSIEALVDEPPDRPVDETRPLVSPEMRGHPPYAYSKAAGQRKVQEAIAAGLDAIIIYPTATIGPHDYGRGLPNSGVLALNGGKMPALIPGGFDWVDVRDVAASAIRAAETAPGGEQYILGGHWMSLRDMAHLVEELSGFPAPRLVIPTWLARAIAPFAEAYGGLAHQRPLLTSAALRPLRSNPNISHARAERELGHNPRPLRDTVTDTLHWFGRL